MSWYGDGLRRWWDARRHRGDAVACPLCEHGFDAWAPGDRCWRCGALPHHRATWTTLAAHPELLGRVERVVHLSPQYGLRNRIARESGFEYVTADPDPHRANIVPALLETESFDGAVTTEAGDRPEAERLLRPGGWLVSPGEVTRR